MLVKKEKEEESFGHLAWHSVSLSGKCEGMASQVVETASLCATKVPLSLVLCNERKEEKANK